MALLLALLEPCARADSFDWTDGMWGILVSTNGAAGTPSCPVYFPGGNKTGNVIAIHFALQPTNIPQTHALLTDGFIRQASPQAPFLTSYRLFRYFGSNDADQDQPKGVQFHVFGTNVAGELQILAVYSNNTTSGSDSFRITVDVTIERPDALSASMRLDVAISNASGHAVAPFWQGHRDLSEQWVPFSVSSMYVADNLTGGLPTWYTTLDPGLLFVGITNDASFLNDGHSVNGNISVSTHDAKYIVASTTLVALAHGTNECPISFPPGYLWYSQLVMRSISASNVLVQHAYRSERNHRIEVLACSGLVTNPADLKWATTFNRGDGNMVDGDNVQVKLGMNEAVNIWPGGAVQTLRLRVTAGNTRPSISSIAGSSNGVFQITWTTEPGELYRVDVAGHPSDPWSNALDDAATPASITTHTSSTTIRIAETNGP